MEVALACSFVQPRPRLCAAFTDADEFLVLTDGTPDLPTLLRDYESYGGLGANWRIFGSSEWRAWQLVDSRAACMTGGRGGLPGLGREGQEGRTFGACGECDAWCRLVSEHNLLVHEERQLALTAAFTARPVCRWAPHAPTLCPPRLHSLHAC